MIPCFPPSIYSVNALVCGSGLFEYLHLNIHHATFHFRKLYVSPRLPCREGIFQARKDCAAGIGAELYPGLLPRQAADVNGACAEEV